MLAQRRLANLKLSSYLGLGDTKGRSALDQRALGIGRHIFGWHFTFPIAQPRDARALYGKRGGVHVEGSLAEALRYINPAFRDTSSLFVRYAYRAGL
jgi:hypothetical protein